MAGRQHDVAVIGLGAMGSLALRELARRGADVVGFEQFSIPHDRGSYPGLSRAFRLAYYEHLDYVPLLKRAHTCLLALNQQTADPVFIETGGLYVGLPDSPLIAGSLAAAAEHDVPCEALSNAEVRARYPQFRMPDSFAGIFEPRGGILLPEKIVAAAVDDARAHGAAVHENSTIRSVDQASTGPGAGVQIITDDGAWSASHAIVTAGAWTHQLLGDIGVALRVSRQTLGWFEPPRDASSREQFCPPAMPMWGWDDPDGIFRYGFPILDDVHAGVKIAHHNPGPTIDPNVVDRRATREDQAELAASFTHVFGEPEPRAIAVQTCMYTNTPDEHFVVDRHPTSDRIIIASGFSGHGFKFASVMGEVLADLAERGRSDLPIEFLSLRRFTHA